uniref:Uncharacterized protein n=1 Tax=Glossina pallidipes TaxID=7398 RepID=A0A1B0AC97_GLOPL
MKAHREAKVVQPVKWLEGGEESKLFDAPIELHRAVRTLVANTDKAHRERPRRLEREMLFKSVWYQLTMMRDEERYILRLPSKPPARYRPREYNRGHQGREVGSSSFRPAKQVTSTNRLTYCNKLKHAAIIAAASKTTAPTTVINNQHH